MKLKTPSMDDLSKIAECRYIVFPDSITSKLGKRYLKKIFEMFIISPHNFVFYIEENKKCVGYCSGSMDTLEITALGSTSSMVHYAFWEGSRSLMLKPWLIFNKSIIKQFPFIMRKIFERVKKIFCGKYYVIDKINNSIKTVWIVDIGVHPEYRRLGIGSELLVEFDNRVKNFGILRGGLSVDKSNLGAIKTYKKHGWEITQVRPSSFVMTKNYSN